MLEIGDKAAGIERISTTFWQDFSIADVFGASAVQDTYNRAFAEWKNNVQYLAEMVVVLNHKIWQHYEEGNQELSKLYDRLWREAQDYGYDHFEGDEFTFFWTVLD